MEPALTGAVSFWEAALGGPPTPRPPLNENLQADVCIVGAGYTGLWVAWALATGDPALRIVVVEAEYAGFGASGRNGGWLSGLLPGDRHRLAQGEQGRQGVVQLQRHLIDAVGSVAKVCAEEGIDADIHHGGTLAVATTPAQMSRLRSSLNEDRSWGVGPDDAWDLGAADVADRVAVAGAVGGTYNPHCARIQPAKLVRGLAEAVSRRGVTVFEQTPAVSLEPGLVRTTRGDIAAPWVVRATEGYTSGLPGLRRRLLPMNSSMIVTDPLPPVAWERIGWTGRETLRDAAHVYVYAQRTADDRIAIGGRGVPYRFGSHFDQAGSTAASTAHQLASSLRRLLPGAGDFGLARAWSGVLGVSRDWCPSIGIERAANGGIAWAGGYTGDGVTTSHLAGLTLADLILGRDTSRTSLPWVGHASPDWEPEPFRWLGVRGIYALYRAADRAESRAGAGATTSVWAKLADRVSGKP